MIKFLELVRLKFKQIIASPILLVIFFLLPFLLTLVQGQVASQNRRDQISAGLIDQAQNEWSQELASSLLAHSSAWELISEDQAEPALIREDLAALLLIPEGFHPLYQSKLRVLQTKQDIGLYVLEEDIASELIRLQFEARLLENLQVTRRLDDQAMEKLSLEFRDRTRDRAKEYGLIEVEVTGIEEMGEARETIIYMPPYNMEILFLSLFSLVLLVDMPKPTIRYKVKRSFKAYALDNLSQVTSLFLLGLVQILVFGLGFYVLMPQVSLGLEDFLVLISFLAIQLSFSQVFRLIPSQSRLSIALLIVVLSGALGSAFFALPSQILRMTAQFNPHAWATASLDGMKVYPAGQVLLFSIFLYILGLVLNFVLENKQITHKRS